MSPSRQILTLGIAATLLSACGGAADMDRTSGALVVA